MHLTSSLCLLLAIATTAAYAQNDKYRMNGDYLDVPVRGGYRFATNDNDGYLEDGIIVKTKGTGFIDSRYRKRIAQPVQPQQSLFGQYRPNSNIGQPQPQLYYYNARPHEVASSFVNSRFASPEIIYGRRAW